MLEAQEYKLKKQKLMGQTPKVEKQDKTTSGKEDPTPEKDDPEKAKSGDTDDMPMLIRDDKDDGSTKNIGKK